MNEVPYTAAESLDSERYSASCGVIPVEYKDLYRTPYYELLFKGSWCTVLLRTASPQWVRACVLVFFSSPSRHLFFCFSSRILQARGCGPATLHGCFSLSLSTVSPSRLVWCSRLRSPAYACVRCESLPRSTHHRLLRHGNRSRSEAISNKISHCVFG